MKRFMTKKVAVVGLVVALVIGVGGAAFAYFSTTGTGSGAAQVGTASNVTITQIGAAYNSLVTGNGYVQDQTYGGQGLTEFGNEVNLSATGILSNVVVAMRNYDGPMTGLPITLTFYAPGATAGSVGSALISDTQNFNFAGPNADGSPSVSNITFDFSSDAFPLPSPVVYSVGWDTGLTAYAGGLNVALSNAATQNTVGSDVYPGYVFADSTWSTGLTGDAGSCATEPMNSFQLVQVWCNDTPLNNWGAYGNSTGADIPAVQINVVGGSTPPLYPGDTQEVDFAITNPNPGNVYVNTVTIALKTDGGDAANQSSTDIPGCLAAWFTINGSPVSLAQNIPSGTTQFQGVANIQMLNPAIAQNACVGATVGLSFTSN